MPINVPDDYVYLDYAASAPLGEEAARAMEPFLAPGLANVKLGLNANSLHAPGRAAYQAMELARRDLARVLGASRPNEVVFTSGATEADNMALAGIARAVARERGRGDAGFVPRIVTTAIEHDAVLSPADRLAHEGFEVVYVKPDRQGFISASAVSDVLDERTVLVSVQAANSEVGTVQAIADIARAAHGAGALFHTDATQALGKVPVDVRALDVDAASFSAHKVGGPKGVGALYVKARTPIDPLLLGGGQEDGRRSTTQNVAGIVGFAAAANAAVEAMADEASRERVLRDRLYRELVEAGRGRVKATVNVPAGSERHLPNVMHVLVEGMESETLVLRLDHAGFGVSGGSACASHSLEPSHVLRALGLTADEAYGALRVSIGRYTTDTDIDRFIAAFGNMLGSCP